MQINQEREADEAEEESESKIRDQEVNQEHQRSFKQSTLKHPPGRDR